MTVLFKSLTTFGYCNVTVDPCGNIIIFPRC